MFDRDHVRTSFVQLACHLQQLFAGAPRKKIKQISHHGHCLFVLFVYARSSCRADVVAPLSPESPPCHTCHLRRCVRSSEARVAQWRPGGDLPAARGAPRVAEARLHLAAAQLRRFGPRGGSLIGSAWFRLVGEWFFGGDRRVGRVQRCIGWVMLDG